MADNYPFTNRVIEIIETKNDPRITLVWLAEEIGRTRRWFYGITDFTKLEFGLIEKISAALDFNFEDDYNKWRLDNGQPALFIAHEPTVEYKVRQRKASINLTLTGTEENAEENIGKLYKAVREVSEQLGFEVTKNETVFI